MASPRFALSAAAGACHLQRWRRPLAFCAGPRIAIGPVTPNVKTMPAKAKMRTAKQTSERRLDAMLDEALAGTFPASDPVAVGGATSTEPPARPVDRKAPLIDAEEVAALRCRR